MARQDAQVGVGGGSATKLHVGTMRSRKFISIQLRGKFSYHEEMKEGAEKGDDWLVGVLG